MRPLRFGDGEATQEVAEILDRWPGADHDYFRVRTAGGGSFILRHDEYSDTWEIAAFDEADEV